MAEAPTFNHRVFGGSLLALGCAPAQDVFQMTAAENA
jgi:hypothetical protein